MTTLQRTGSTRAARPIAVRRSRAKVFVPIAAGTAVGALALTAILQAGVAGGSSPALAAVAPSVADLTAAGAQGYEVSLVSAVDAEGDQQVVDDAAVAPTTAPRANDLAGIVVETPTPTPTPTPTATSEDSSSSKSESSGSSSGGGSSPAYVAPDPGTAKALAADIVAQNGWGTSEFACLERLWQRESGWNAAAENPSSGAYGIPQSLPGSKMATHGSDWRTNPETQIRWGIDYIKGRYGTPCGAWAHSEAKNWY